MGSVVAATRGGEIHRAGCEAGRSWGAGRGHCELALGEKPPHPALLKGPDHGCAAGCYGNHTWVMTPISKAWAG